MKSFTAALVLLAIMLICIVWNYIYINEVFSEMNAMLDRLPDVGNEDCSTAAAAICDYWESHVDTVGLSVGYTVVDRVSEQAATMLSCASCKDLYGFRTAVALLRDALGDMRRLEDFSVGNLL